ncbi:MAG TPA: hypothetical protein VM577_18495 [Anaerovoracaceae bacterium]|nr:hypothetical protein [Anaerovoracaceae bacterium]
MSEFKESLEMVRQWVMKKLAMYEFRELEGKKTQFLLDTLGKMAFSEQEKEDILRLEVELAILGIASGQTLYTKLIDEMKANAGDEAVKEFVSRAFHLSIYADCVRDVCGNFVFSREGIESAKKRFVEEGYITEEHEYFDVEMDGNVLRDKN